MRLNMSVELENAPPTVNQVPAFHMELFAMCLNRAVRKYIYQKIKAEEKEQE